MTTYHMKELPIDDRPREKLVNSGAAALTDSELLAILIGSGTREKSALDIAHDLTADNGILKNIASVHDVLELGKRIASAEPLVRDSITSPEDGVALLMPRLRYESKEHFLVVLLNSKNKVLDIEQISEGSLNSSVVHPREVFTPAVLHHAAAILTAHNHPSGDPTPSKEDKDLTSTLVQAGKYMGIPVLDHIIIGDAKYFSFKEHSYL